MRDRIGVENVVYADRCARLVAEPLSTRRAERHDLVAYVCDALNDLCLGGTTDIEDGVDMLVVKPFARDCPGAVAAVVVVRHDKLNRCAEHLPAEIRHRHLRGGRAALPGILRIRPRQVEDQPDLYNPVGNLRRRRDAGTAK